MAQSTYTQGHNASTLRSHTSRHAADTCGYFLDRIKPDFRILDAGCGPGTVTISLAEYVPKGKITGIDSSKDVIEKARGQATVPTNCSFKVADLTKLAFDDDSFDVVYTSQTLVHVPDTTTAFKELRRVCKPGGFIACREGDAAATMIHPEDSRLELWRQALIETASKSGSHSCAGRFLIEWALSVGFQPGQITYSIGSLTYYGDSRRFWGETMAARVMEDQVWREKRMALGTASEKDFQDMRDGWLAFAENESALFAMPCGQIICYK